MPWWSQSRRTTGRADEDFPLFFTDDSKSILVGYDGRGRGHDYGEIVVYDLFGN
jgi:hypothetical protein